MRVSRPGETDSLRLLRRTGHVSGLSLTIVAKTEDAPGINTELRVYVLQIEAQERSKAVRPRTLAIPACKLGLFVCLFVLPKIMIGV